MDYHVTIYLFVRRHTSNPLWLATEKDVMEGTAAEPTGERIATAAVAGGSLTAAMAVLNGPLAIAPGPLACESTPHRAGWTVLITSPT
jgi:hypothetical protein